MKAAAVLLAAGASSRLGKPKQLAEIGSERLIEKALRACFEAQLEPVLVVLGANASKMTRKGRYQGPVLSTL